MGIDLGLELRDGDSIVGGLRFHHWTFVGIGLGAEDGMCLGDVGGICEGVVVYCRVVLEFNAFIPCHTPPQNHEKRQYSLGLPIAF